MNPFLQLGLSEQLANTLGEIGYKEPTQIQKLAIPKALTGKDLLASAQTGTGKTAAFMLPTIERIKSVASPSFSPLMHPVRVLVITPTRELADQIEKNTADYLRGIPLKHCVIFGGTNMDQQAAELKKGQDIVIATVGRLKDHLEKKNIQLNRVEILIIDEADRMLDMGFIDDVRNIMRLLPERKQVLLFSATFPDEIRKLADKFMKNPEEVAAARVNSVANTIIQHVVAVNPEKKPDILVNIVTKLKISRVIIFCSTKISVDKVTRLLQNNGVNADSIHGDKSQYQRLETLEKFKNNELKVLVATDVAARGLDIDLLNFVINYEFPNQAEDYIHRIGRTGRKGSKGVAISFMDNPDELAMFEEIEKLMNQEIRVEHISGYESTWFNHRKYYANDEIYNDDGEEAGEPADGYARDEFADSDSDSDPIADSRQGSSDGEGASSQRAPRGQGRDASQRQAKGDQGRPEIRARAEDVSPDEEIQGSHLRELKEHKEKRQPRSRDGQGDSPSSRSRGDSQSQGQGGQEARPIRLRGDKDRARGRRDEESSQGADESHRSRRFRRAADETCALLLPNFGIGMRRSSQNGKGGSKGGEEGSES